MNVVKSVQLTDKQFKLKLNGFIKSSLNQRDNCQQLIVEGIAQYKDCGNTSRLTMFLNESVVVKSIPTVTIKDFIKEHTDLVYKPNKAGDYQFVRADKNAEKKAELPTDKWYDWKKAKHNAVKEKDYVKALTTDVKGALSKGVNRSDIVRGLLAGGLTVTDILAYSDIPEYMKATDKANNNPAKKELFSMTAALSDVG
jgi:hypothetical protein